MSSTPDFATLVMGAETRGLKKGEKALDDVVGAAGRAEDAVDGVGDGFDHAGDAAKRAKPKLKEGADQADRVAVGAAKAAKALGAFALGYASLQAVSGGVSMAREFNAAIAETSTLIEGTPEQLKMISDEARGMARAFGGDAKSQVEAFYQAISAGAGTVEQAASVLDQANRLAIGGATDVTTATGILSTATNVYGASGLTAAEASDALFVAMKQGTTTIGELSGSLGKVLPLAEKLGVDFDEVAAATAALTKGGISTSESVTGLRAALAAILAPSDEARKLAISLGLEFSSAGLEAEGFAGFMTDVVDKTEGSNEALQTLFSSIEATGAVLSLSGAAGQFMAENLELMANKSGMTEAAFLKMSSSLDQRWNRATAAGRDAMLLFGNAALTVVVPALEAVVATGAFVADNIDMIALAVGALAVTQLPALVAGAYAAITAISIMELQFIAGAVAAHGMAVATRVLNTAVSALGGPVGIALGVISAVAGVMMMTSGASEELRASVDAATGAHESLNRASSAFVLDGPQSVKAFQERAKAAREAAASALSMARAELETVRSGMALRLLWSSGYSISKEYMAVQEAVDNMAGSFASADSALDAANVAAGRVAGTIVTVKTEAQILAQKAREFEAALAGAAKEYALTRAQSDLAQASADKVLQTFHQQAILSRIIAKYGADSVQASDYQYGIERAALATKHRAEGLAESMVQKILAAADAAHRADLAVDALSGKIANAASNAAILASNLGAAARGAEQTAEKQIAVIQARIEALGAGQDAYLAGSQAALQVDKDRYQQALLSSGASAQAAQLATERHFENQDAVIQLTAAERALTASVKATGKASSGASSSAVTGFLAEIKHRKTLLGLTVDQRKQYQAILTVQQKLGKDAGKYSKQQISDYADQLVSLENSEAALQRLNDLQGQWSENITRTAFEGGSLSDTVEGMLRDIGYQFTHSKVILPITASVTNILGLDQLLLGTTSSGALGAGGGSGSGLLGGLGSSLLGGGGLLSGAGLGFSTLASGGIGGYGALLGAQGAAALTGSASAMVGLTGALGPVALLAGGLYALSKAFSREYTGTAIRGNLGADGFTGDQFDFYKGGAFRSNKETHSSLATELQALLDSTMQGVTTGLKGMALSLGLGTSALAGFNDEQFTLWTQGKDATQIQQELQVHMDAAADDMAALVLGTEDFSRSGESASETLTRLSTGLTSVNDAMDLLDQTAFAMSLSSADVASQLVDRFGGLEAMTGAVTTYWAAFYSDAERSETTLRRLSETFADLGVTMPQSRDGFRDLVEGIDLTTASGRELYAGVLGLSGAMDQVLPKLGQFTAAMTGILDQIGGQIGSQIDVARSFATDAKSAASLWYRTATTLRDFLGDLVNSDLTAASGVQASAVNQARFQTAFQKARGGDIDAARDISALAKDYLTTAKAGAKTELEYRRIASQVQGQVNFLAGLSELEGANKDVLETLYEQQINVLTNLGNFLQLEGLTGTQIEGLDQSIQDMATNWDGTIATFDTSLTSLEGAIREAELFSYDYLKERLNVAVDLLPSADIPPYLQALVGQAESGITSTIDFVVRSDLSAPMKWLAVNSASEHIKSLDFILREDLGPMTRVLALATDSELRRNIRFIVAEDLDADTRQIALAGNSELSRVVNVALDSASSDVQALQLALENVGGYAVAVSAAFSPDVSAAVRRLVLDQSGGYAAMIEASMTLLDGNARRILLAQQGLYTVNIHGVLAASLSEPLALLLLNANTWAVRGVTIGSVFADTLTDQQRELLMSNGTTALRAITATLDSLGVDMTGGQLLDQLQAGNGGIHRNVHSDFISAVNGTDARLLSQLEIGTASIDRTINGLVNIDALSPQQTALLNSISGASSGTITLAGTYRFAPEGAFQTWFSDTTKAHIVAPMLLLRENLDQLRAAVDADRWARHNAAEKQSQIATITAAASGVSGTIADNQQWAANLVGKVEALQASTGTQLMLGNGAGVLGLNLDGSINYNADGVMGGNVAAFGAEFWGVGGYEDYMARASGSIVGGGDQLEVLRQQIRSLDGIPSFDGGGWTGNGARSGGLDGKGGLLAMLHPQEQVIDYSSRAHVPRPTGDSAVVQMLRRVEERLARIEAQDRQIGVASIRHQKDTAKSLKVFEIDRREAGQTA